MRSKLEYASMVNLLDRPSTARVRKFPRSERVPVRRALSSSSPGSQTEPTAELERTTWRFEPTDTARAERGRRAGCFGTTEWGCRTVCPAAPGGLYASSSSSSTLALGAGGRSSLSRRSVSSLTIFRPRIFACTIQLGTSVCCVSCCFSMRVLLAI